MGDLSFPRQRRMQSTKTASGRFIVIGGEKRIRRNWRQVEDLPSLGHFSLSRRPPWVVESGPNRAADCALRRRRVEDLSLSRGKRLQSTMKASGRIIIIGGKKIYHCWREVEDLSLLEDFSRSRLSLWFVESGPNRPAARKRNWYLERALLF